MPAEYPQLLQHLSQRIRLTALRAKLGEGFPLLVTQLYELWRSNRLVVQRDWGDASQAAQPVHYTNCVCLLPTDYLELAEATRQEQVIKVATWNVNSIRPRMPLLLSWLEQHRPDIVCLQETKVEDALFPQQELALVGYQTVFSGQKTYNGVAILSKYKFSEVRYGFSNGYDSENKRLIAAHLLGIWLLNVYVPQGESTESPKFSYKLQFLTELLQELKNTYTPEQALFLLGDYNIAPDSRDVPNPETMAEQVSFHSKEHEILEQFRGWPLADTFRQFNKEAAHYTWWDFRTRGFEKNEGLRIDHIWASSALLPYCRSCKIDTENRGQPKPSDHAPVLAEIALPAEETKNRAFN